LQATRIVPRKGIELAIDVTREFAALRHRLEENELFDGRPFTPKSRIVLVLAGYARDDDTGAYVRKLNEKAAANGVDLLFIEEWIASERGSTNGHKIYSLWDAYVFADLVTYPSLWEGWGNQFLEAVRAKLPIVLFEYPVYRADIRDKGFEVISLGAEVAGRDSAGLARVPHATIQKAADQALDVLSGPIARQRMVQKNLQLGQRYYSMNTLRNILEDEIEQ
jgi:glycosyltransferase involved in cell wall biosynthesis